MAKKGEEKDLKKKKKGDQDEPAPDLSPLALTKALIKEFNSSSETGKIAWNLLTDLDNPTDVKEFITFGARVLDYIVCNKADGGAPVGKLIELSGEEASGKSLICAHMIAECQRRGGVAVYIDTENSANPDFMQRVGVNLATLVYLQPGTVEEVGEAIEKVIISTRTKAPNRLVLVIWDSIAGTPTKGEIEGTVELNMNEQLEKSKVLGKMMRKLTETWGKERICMVFTNQLRTKIGVMYGDPMTTPGGKAVPFHSTVRIRLAKSTEIKDGNGDTVGFRTLAKVIKNRLGPPMRKCEFDIFFANGIDDEGSWFTKLHEVGEITKNDGWCYLKALPNPDGDERGFRFRRAEWNELTKDADIRKLVLALLDKHMVVKYEAKIPDVEIDPESLMDNEAVLAAAQEG